jgi:hypothetical protein
MKPNDKTIELAKQLLKDSKEKQIHIVDGSNHMYSKLENAVAQGKGLKEIYCLKKGENSPTLVFDPKAPAKDSKPEGDILTPDKTWTVEALKKYADDNAIALDEKDTTQKAILAKITAAAAAAGK